MPQLATITGWVLASIGLAVLLWAVFWDRSRGRRRCPKCWYDMSGAPSLTCPECGRVSRREASLFRTRRRWHATIPAFGLLGAAWVVTVADRVGREGWVGFVPTPVAAATAVLLRTGEVSRTDPHLVRSPTEATSTSWRAPIVCATARAVENRGTRKEIWKPLRRGIHRLAWHVLDEDLDRYPAFADPYLEIMLTATSDSIDPRNDSSLNGLVAPHLTIGPVIEGAAVYATVTAVGVSDRHAGLEIRADWLDAQDRPLGDTSPPTWIPVSNEAFGHECQRGVFLGRPPVNSISVRVSVKIWRGDWPIRRDRPPSRERSYLVPITVMPASQDPLTPVTVSATELAARFAATFSESPHRASLHIGNLVAPFVVPYPQTSLNHSVPPLPSPEQDATLGAHVVVVDQSGIVCYEGEVCMAPNPPDASYPWGSSGWRGMNVAWVTLRKVRDPHPSAAALSRVIFNCDPDLA